MEEEFKKRIGYNGEIKYISLQICKDYALGEMKSSKILLTGYEDFNFVLETSKGKYVVKIFKESRDLDDCKKCVDVVKKAIEAGISTPRLFKSSQGYLHILKIGNTKLRLCVMEYLDGKDLFALGEKLSEKEIKFIAEQAALINSLAIKPRFIYDSWAIINFLLEFEKKSKYLSSDDLKLVEPLVKKFKELGIGRLPHCFVHGDIISTNVIRDSHNKLWIIDFSVSNYYPRINEIAVLACNLLFDAKNKDKSKKNLEIGLKEYQKIIKLTEQELSALPVYIQLAHAMHILLASFEKKANKNKSVENEYFLNEGRKGIRQI